MSARYLERRYTIQEASPIVEERLTRAFAERQLASLAIVLSDIYEGDPPIPPSIEHRDIGFSVRRLWIGPQDSVRAFGYTPENAVVTVTVPKDKAEQSTLRLLDAAKPTTPRRSSKKSA